MKNERWEDTGERAETLCIQTAENKERRSIVRRRTRGGLRHSVISARRGAAGFLGRFGENRARCGPVRNPYRCEQSGSVRGKARRRLADGAASAGSGGRGTESAHEAGGAGLCRIEYPDCGRSYGGHFGGEPDSIFRYSGGQRSAGTGDTNVRPSSGRGAGGDEVGRPGGNGSGCKGKGTGAFDSFPGVSGGGSEGI